MADPIWKVFGPQFLALPFQQRNQLWCAARAEQEAEENADRERIDLEKRVAALEEKRLPKVVVKNA